MIMWDSWEGLRYMLHLCCSRKTDDLYFFPSDVFSQTVGVV